MTNLAYIQCPTGIAGDMCLGAIVDVGVPLEYLIEKLKALGIEQEYQLRAEKVHRNNQVATKVHVELLREDHHHHHDASAHRHLPEIERLIEGAQLPPRASAWSLAIFRRLAEAEAAVHGVAPDQVHFHEVGATDAIVDIVGTCLGLDWLGIEELYCSALPTGGGTVRAAHGQLPVPVPAVLKLWESRQVPVYSNGIERELCTPTGVAIAVTLATNFGPPPAMTIQRIGNGAGSRDLPIPNILRLWVGDSSVGETNKNKLLAKDVSLETISLLETQIDDLSPQAIGYVFEALFAVGAVDVFTQAIGMKKSRPGILLTVVCHPEHLSACESILFRETTTLGIRRLTQQRAILQREIQQVQTEYGEVRVKVAWSGDSGEKTIMNVQPEYEDCAQLARLNQRPWREIHQ
ncbi:MAG TPA: nickel pincer cofactor biosynthesis protein LarC, partial [Candidatus Obscuribacterales bacterium]